MTPSQTMITHWKKNSLDFLLKEWYTMYMVEEEMKMTNAQIAKAIRHGLFAERDTLKEAFDFAFEVIGRVKKSEQIAVTTALYVVLNTLSNEILKNEEN